mgnify:CR=1 FL=1
MLKIKMIWIKCLEEKNNSKISKKMKKIVSKIENKEKKLIDNPEFTSFFKINNLTLGN